MSSRIGTWQAAEMTSELLAPIGIGLLNDTIVKTIGTSAKTAAETNIESRAMVEYPIPM